MAAEIKTSLGLDTVLEVGDSGEFTVWVGDRMVAEKKWMSFPSPKDVVEAIQEATGVTPL